MRKLKASEKLGLKAALAGVVAGAGAAWALPAASPWLWWGFGTFVTLGVFLKLHRIEADRRIIDSPSINAPER